MELNQFLEKFCPRYEQYKKHVFHVCGFNETTEQLNIALYICIYHPQAHVEALQNFTDKILEAQIQLCAEIITERIDDHECEPFEDGMYVTAGDMYYAGRPKIEEL